MCGRRHRGLGRLAVEAERRLHEVVRPDRQEVRLECDLRRTGSGAGRLDHRAERRQLRTRAGRRAQQSAHRPHLLRRLDEREQDAERRAPGDAQQGAQLCYERVLVCEEQPDPALGGADEERRRLVGAEVERAHRGHAAGERREHRRERGRMVVLRRPRPHVEERELRAQQADALGAQLEPGRHLRRSRRVAEQPHRPAVDRHGRQRTLRRSVCGRPPPPRDRRARTGERVRTWVHFERALVAVEDRRVRLDELADADDHRHPERARHDRGVRGDGAAREREPEQPLGVEAELRHLRRTEVDGGDDRGLREPEARTAAERLHRAPAERAHVVGPRGERRLAEGVEQPGMTSSRLQEGLVHRQRLRQRPHLGAERRVERHQAVRVDDLRLYGVSRVAQPLCRDRELGRGCLERRRRIPGRRLRSVEQHDAPDRDAGRGRNAAQHAHAHRPLSVWRGCGGTGRFPYGSEPKASDAHPSAGTARASAATINAVEVAPGS